MILLITHVGFLINLWFFVRSLDLALSYYPASRWRTITYAILALLLLLALLINLGFHA